MIKIIHFNLNRGKFEVQPVSAQPRWTDNLKKSKFERDILGPKDEF